MGWLEYIAHGVTHEIAHEHGIQYQVPGIYFQWPVVCHDDEREMCCLLHVLLLV